MVEPIRYSDLERKLGTYLECKDDLVVVKVPFPLRLSWEPTYISKVLVHPRIADGLVAALKNIMDYYGRTFIKKNNLDEFGGAYNPRKSRGSNRMSVHAWAMAVDYLPSMGGFHVPAITPEPVVRAFKAQGFLWGGDWGHPDGMHFTGVIE